MTAKPPVKYKDYEAHKRAMADRSRQKSLAGRDIAPMPPVKDPRRKSRCRLDLTRFAREYFPEKVAWDFCPNHLKYLARLEDIILHGGKQAIAMPRGSGKSTLAKIATKWAVAYGHRRFVLIICATKEEAVAFMNDIKEMAKAPRFAEDFPEIAYPIQRLKGSALLARGQLFYGKPTAVKWREAEIVYPTVPGSPASGSVISTKGITGAMRGKSAAYQGETLRPDLCIIDDPQKDEDAVNAERVAKIERKINRTIAGLVEDGQTLAQIMTCTVMEPGDVADRFLDNDIYPTWHGLRFKMVEEFPTRLDLWLKDYAQARAKSEEEGNKFYLAHRAEMDEGAVVDWPQRYDPTKEFSRLHRAMNALVDDADAFYSERQNEPRGKKKDAVLVSPKDIRMHLNGYDRRIVPDGAHTLTGFIDVHNDILYYVICAWADDRTGYVIDYGTYPEQRRNYFFKSAPGNETLRQVYRGYDVEGAIQEGVRELAAELLTEDYMTSDKVVMPVNRLLIDSGYKRAEVENAIRLLKMPALGVSKGRGIRASSKPISEYQREPGDRIGHYWVEKITKGRSFKTVFIDTNYWKTEVHNSFSLGPGDRSGLTLWGTTPERHRMFSEHCAAEQVQLVKAGERELYEWTQVPGQDNHLFDCIVGCMAAASTLGVKKPGAPVGDVRPAKDQPRR